MTSAEPHRLLPTAVVGSYPQPDWLIDRSRLAKVPRVRVPDAWRIGPDRLAEAQDDATIVAIHEQERAGVDIVTDGEIRRESYSNHFSTALSGIGVEPGIVEVFNAGARVEVPVPSFSGEVCRHSAVEVDNARFLLAHTSRVTKMTLPGPFTMAKQAVSPFYPDSEALAMALADAVNAEIRDLFAAGIDVVQLDEPWMQRFPEDARRFGVRVVDRVLAGITGTVALHMCFGYAAVVRGEKPSSYQFLDELADTAVDHISIEAAQPHLELSSLATIARSKRLMVGVLDLGDPSVESPAVIAERIERILEVVPPERLIVGPDCGMKFLPRELAYGKLSAMVEAAALVRDRLMRG